MKILLGLGCLSVHFRRLKPKCHYADFPETSLWHVARESFEGSRRLVTSRGSRRHGSCYAEVTRGSFGISKPSRHAEIVWKIPMTSRQQALLRRRRPRQDKAGSQRRRGQINGDVTGLSRTCRGTSRGSRHSRIWAWTNSVSFKLAHLTTKF